MVRTSSTSSSVQNSMSEGREIIGYIYPHFPLELVLGHGLVPTLIRTDPDIQGAFESSLQTFACGYVRNLFSQRARGGLSFLSGIAFPNNTCDSLQNVGDVWRYRFSDDIVLRITYPVSDYGKASIQFLARELRMFSNRLEVEFGNSFSIESYRSAVKMINELRMRLQMLYSAKALIPGIIQYPNLVRAVRRLLVEPSQEGLEEITQIVEKTVNSQQPKIVNDINELRKMLQAQSIEREFDVEREYPRIAIAGGMADPQILARLLEELGEDVKFSIAIDLLSFGFKTVFSAIMSTEEDPFIEMAKTILSSPREPTQEGLVNRLRFLREILINLKIDGLIILEQSFCDPDEFEAPSLERVARDIEVPVVRLPIDPELSDLGRVRLRLQSFIENLPEVV